MVDWIGMFNYVRGDVSCVAILTFLMLNVIKKRRRGESRTVFIELIIWMNLYILTYSASGVFKYGYVRPAPSVYNAVILVVMISQTMVAYKWFCYSEIRQRTLNAGTGRWQTFAYIPAVLFILASVVSLKTKWIFFIDEELTYHRGNLFALQYIVIALYMAATSLKALVKSSMRKNYVQRGELFTLFTFIVPPTVTTILQAVIPMGVFLVGYGFTFSIIMVYLNATQEQVSQDGLTRLNNRTHMSRFLSSRMNAGNDRLYLLIIDANSFKEINDTYGHIEGDNALVRIAKALTMAAHVYSCYVSRYGGDEFIVIYEADSEEKVKELCGAIQEKLRELNASSGVGYEVSVSIGYAKYNDGIKTIPDLIEAADAHLRRRKAEIHGAGRAGRAD